MSLEALGWRPFFETAYTGIAGKKQSPGRVVSVHKKGFFVNDGTTVRSAYPSGQLRRNRHTGGMFPCTGDWVIMDPPGTGEQSRITRVLPRENSLCRHDAGTRHIKSGGRVKQQVIAANLDHVFIVCGLDRDFNPRRIERYLSTVYASEVPPVILLNKADMYADPSIFLVEAKQTVIDAPIYMISAETGMGMAAVEAYLAPRKTIALMGSSGVGKSTLVNRLAGWDQRKTSRISDAVGKGVHTTSSRDLILLPGGAMLIDNPGIRELGLWDEGEGVSATFADIEALALGCRFSNCTHMSEPGCAILHALETETLDIERYVSYRKQQEEIDQLAERKARTPLKNKK
ncbi:MAG: ribosome small subunit-dependent GTPase A [Deltaproteobacteria bacterium]|nr:MAG: ribosome small subunit-dependent GTPase A [Deltaproteobacteria bacterium]